jgi:hypothetical protein
MRLTESPSSVSPDYHDESLPTRAEWLEIATRLNRDIECYPDESPELAEADLFDLDPDDVAWWDELTGGGCGPHDLSPDEIGFLTAATDWHPGSEEDPAFNEHFDERRDAFLGEVG